MTNPTRHQTPDTSLAAKNQSVRARRLGNAGRKHDCQPYQRLNAQNVCSCQQALDPPNSPSPTNPYAIFCPNKLFQLICYCGWQRWLTMRWQKRSPLNVKFLRMLKAARHQAELPWGYQHWFSSTSFSKKIKKKTSIKYKKFIPKCFVNSAANNQMSFNRNFAIPII